MPTLEDFFGIDLNSTHHSNESTPAKTAQAGVKAKQKAAANSKKTAQISPQPSDTTTNSKTTIKEMLGEKTPGKLKTIKSKDTLLLESPPLNEKNAVSPAKKKLLPLLKPNPQTNQTSAACLFSISPTKENKKAPTSRSVSPNKQPKTGSKLLPKAQKPPKTSITVAKTNADNKEVIVMPENIKFEFGDLDKVLDQVESSIEKHKQTGAVNSTTTSEQQFLFDLLNIENTSPNTPCRLNNNNNNSSSTVAHNVSENGDVNGSDEKSTEINFKLNQFTTATNTNLSSKANKSLANGLKSHLKFNGGSKAVLSTPPSLLSSKQTSKFKKGFLGDEDDVDNDDLRNHQHIDEEVNGFEDSNDFFSFLDTMKTSEAPKQQRTPLKPDNSKKRGRPPKPVTAIGAKQDEMGEKDGDTLLSKSDNSGLNKNHDSFELSYAENELHQQVCGNILCSRIFRYRYFAE